MFFGKPNNPHAWSDQIERGIKAFLRMKKSANSDECLQRDLDEALPFVLPLVGVPNVPFREVRVGLLRPEGMSELDYHALLGPNAHPTVGLQGLAEAFEAIFKCWGDGGDTHRVGVVLTRPPESYVVLRGDDPRIFFRDSHRQTQRDFSTIDVFLKWLKVEVALFTPMTSCPAENNMVALWVLAETVATKLYQATL